MAAAVTYTNFCGTLVSESRSDVERQYISDPLGSLVGELDSNQSAIYTAEYWPYGEIQTEIGTNTSDWSFVGLFGYLRDLPSLLYVRARHYLPHRARWLTVDPLWPSEKAYQYVGNRPAFRIDWLGMAKIPISEDLCLALLAKEMDEKAIKELGDCLDKCVTKPKSKKRSCMTDCIKKHGPVDQSKMYLYIACIIVHQDARKGWSVNPCMQNKESDACCSMYFYECLFKRMEEEGKFEKICDAIMPGRVVLDCQEYAIQNCENDTFVAPPIDRGWLK